MFIRDRAFILSKVYKPAHLLGTALRRGGTDIGTPFNTLIRLQIPITSGCLQATAKREVIILETHTY